MGGGGGGGSEGERDRERERERERETERELRDNRKDLCVLSYVFFHLYDPES